MSTTLTSAPSAAPGGPDGDRSRARKVKRAWLVAAGLGAAGIVIGAAVLFSWMVDETHFDRPSAEFDRFAAQVEDLPGVDAVVTERWVEAPTFSDPTSWMSVTVQQPGLPGVLEAACSPGYPDPITWSLTVRTPAAAEVSLSASSPGESDDASRCPDFGFDAVRLVAELDRAAPGLAIAPSTWRDGRLTLVALEDELPAGFTHLLPLAGHSEALLAAAGLRAADDLEINSANLGVVLEAGESDECLLLLTELAEVRGVTSFWVDDGGASADGAAKVQVVAPDAQHAAIERAIRSSGLRIADLPVRFLEQ